MAHRRGRISKSDIEQILISLNEIDVQLRERASYDDLFSLARAHGLTIYDAAYLNLALLERMPLASLDRQLIRAGAAVGVEIFQP